MNGNQLRVLVVDDDEDDIFLVKELLKEGLPEWNVTLDYAMTGDQAISLIEKAKHHICIFDYHLGKTNGLSLFNKIKNNGDFAPVIFLTAQGDQEIAVEVMKAGATDYLVKSRLSVETLARSVRAAIKLEEQKTQRSLAEHSLKIQGELLQGVSNATQKLLTITDFDSAISQALAELTKAANVESAFIFKHSQKPGDTPICNLEFFSSKNKYIESNELKKTDLSYADLGIEEVFLPLNRQQSVIVYEKEEAEFPEGFFKELNITSLLLFPIEINSTTWGLVALGSKKNGRVWLNNEKSILEVVVANIGGEIKRQIEKVAFQLIVEGTSSRVGNEFFRSLVRHLAKALSVKCAFVNEPINIKDLQCAILAGWDEGDYVDKKIFNAMNTPGEEVLAGMLVFHPDKIMDAYPNDQSLKDSKVISYAGVPCFDSHYKTIGHLVVMDDKPMLDEKRTLSILKIFAARAGAELERKRTESVMRDMAYHDALTGLPNRILLNDRLERALLQAQRNNSLVGLLYIDFDRFKQINDTLGHGVGDELLKSVGNRLKECLRQQDTVARLGGDEFILLLPEISNEEDAGKLANKLLDKIRPSFQIGQHEIIITLSIGIALYPQDAGDAKSLIKCSDEALYLAKNNGRDCYQFFKQ
ncbi:MAG: diguanylate cyclase [Nitrospinaceae bacterium]|nr:diguanylate cyclase [Nitrospinaceae bacterium]